MTAITILAGSTTTEVEVDEQTDFAVRWRLFVAGTHPTPAQLGAWLAAHAG